MDFSKIFALLPVVMSAIETVKNIQHQREAGDSVVKIIQSKGPEVLDLVTKVGAELFPRLDQGQQVQAGVLRFDVELTKRIQAALNGHGAKLTPDGLYGPATKAAVQSFQTKNGLDADGWAGPKTQAKLFK